MASWQSAFGVMKVDGFSGSPRQNVIRSAVEIGEGKERRQRTGKHSDMTGKRIFSRATFATFQTWWEDDIAEGTIPFTMTDPLRQDTGTFKMRNWSFNAVSGDEIEMTFELRRVA